MYCITPGLAAKADGAGETTGLLAPAKYLANANYPHFRGEIYRIIARNLLHCRTLDLLPCAPHTIQRLPRRLAEKYWAREPKAWTRERACERP